MSAKKVFNSMNATAYTFLGMWFLFGSLPNGNSFFRIGWPSKSFRTVHKWVNYHFTNEMFGMSYGLTVREIDEMEAKLRSDIERIILLEEAGKIRSGTAESALADIHDVIEHLRIAKAVRLHNESVTTALA